MGSWVVLNEAVVVRILMLFDLDLFENSAEFYLKFIYIHLKERELSFFFFFDAMSEGFSDFFF